MNSRRARNGRSGNSGEAYHSNAAIPTCYQALMRRLIDTSKRGAETSASGCAEVGDLQYQTRIFEGPKQGWQIINRLEKSGGQVRSFYRIDFDALRKSGRTDLLALVFPGEYPHGAPVTAPAPAQGLLELCAQEGL
jgi:hypothetical protein